MSEDPIVSRDALRQARASYEEAFHKLATEVAVLRELTFQPGADQTQVSEARARVEQAQSAYAASRNLLAELLLARAVHTEQAAVHADERSKVQRLAHLLWESGGRPEGRAEDDWYRAEHLIRTLSASAA